MTKVDIEEFLLFDYNAKYISQILFENYIKWPLIRKANEANLSIHKFLSRIALDIDSKQYEPLIFIHSCLEQVSDKAIYWAVSDCLTKVYGDDFDKLILLDNYDHFVKVGKDIICKYLAEKMNRYAEILKEATFEFIEIE